MILSPACQSLLVAYSSADTLLVGYWQGDQVVGAMHKMLGPCTRLREPACQAVLRAQRLFFLNESQSLSNFLVMDLGILQYPEYQVHRTRSVFPDRAALLAYEQALKQAAALDTELEVRPQLLAMGPLGN